ncbi:MAG: DUF5916 domain-containing protein [Gemmatimonadota bacterium]
MKRLALALFLPVASIAAQSPAPLELPRLTRAIAVDGVPTSEEWKDIPTLPLTLYAPVFKGTPMQRTEIRVAYDDEYFYAAGWFYDDDKVGVRVNSLYRDRWNGDDAFAIYIDAYNDKQNSKWFGTTPGGIRFDQLVSDDGATLNGSWDTFWTAQTTVTDSGWFAEVKIPFSSLGFRVDAEGKVVMGLTVTRLVSRSEERVTFPAIDPKFEFRRPSVAQDVVLRNVRSKNPLYITPYALSGTARNMIRPTGATTFSPVTSRSNEVGADARYALSSNLTLDLTYNMDFAQVEADDQQVNLDRFPLFFPERRRFFQENSGIFDYQFGGGSRLFHSRRIGLTPSFTPLPVLGGARLGGRMGAWDVGLLEMQTERDGVFPSENFGVFRMRRPVLNANSTAGFMATSYVGGGRKNFGLGTDASLRVRPDEYLVLKWAGTVDSGAVNLWSRSIVDARYERRVGRGLQYSFATTHSGKEFRPELGFTQRRDFTTANFYSNYFNFAEVSSSIRRWYPGILAFSTFRNADRVVESGQYALWLQWDTKAGGGGWIEPKLFRESVVQPFTIGNTIKIPAGTYTFSDLQFALSMPAGERLRTTMDLRAGTYFDGRRAQAIINPTWNVSPHLELGADYQLTALRFASRSQTENIQVARLRVRAALDVRMSGNAFLQYNSTTRKLDANVRLRYAFAEGTDLWLVYNEGLDTNRSSDPLGIVQNQPFSLSRSFIVKYSYTFGL